MRADGLWHPRLCALITGLGHHQTLVLADPGLPVPEQVETIDLVWARNQPRLLPVLAAVCSELVVQEAVIAEELTDAALLDGIGAITRGVPLKSTSHEEFKRRCREAAAIVRTGEATAYANVILRAGVPF